MILCGLDEVGRGAFAGPLVAAAVTIPSLERNSIISKIESESRSPIRDSKKLSSIQRFKIFTSVLTTNIPIFMASISAREINEKNMGWANKQIFLNLIDQILTHQKEVNNLQSTIYDLKFIIDGNLKIDKGTVINSHAELACHVPTGAVVSASARSTPCRSRNEFGMTDKCNYSITSLPKADSLYPEVSLASIIAKVARDSYMQDLHAHFPHFGFNTNMGYGTKTHISALRTHGPTTHHRSVYVSTALKSVNQN